MPVTEVLLVFVGIPLAVFLLLAALTLLPGRGKEHPKYRPGQPWTARPVWWEPHPGAAGGHGVDDHADGHHAPELGASAPLAIEGHSYDPHASDGPRRTAAGGARGTW